MKRRLSLTPKVAPWEAPHSCSKTNGRRTYIFLNNPDLLLRVELSTLTLGARIMAHQAQGLFLGVKYGYLRYCTGFQDTLERYQQDTSSVKKKKMMHIRIEPPTGAL